MPQPTLSQVHVNRPLTNISIAYMQRAENFIATKVFPVVPVSKQSDKYFVYDREHWFRDEAQRRAPGTVSAGGGFELSTATYTADVYAYHKDIDDQIRANADAPLQLERDATEFVTQKLMLRREIEWASTHFTTSVWDTDKTGGTDFTKWDDVSSTPIEDIEEQKDTVAKNTGFVPNTLVLGPEVFTQLKNHPDVLDRVKYTQQGVVTEELLAGLFGVDRVLVPRAVKNTANENATASYSYVYGRSALLVYAAPNPGLMQPSGGYTFVWTGLLGGGNNGIRIKTFRIEERSSDRVEGEMAWDMKVVASALGVFFSSAVS